MRRRVIPRTVDVVEGPVWPIVNSTGSMCFFSSTIQAFLNNSSFVQWIDNIDVTTDKPFTLTLKAIRESLKVPEGEMVSGSKHLNKILTYIEPHLNKRGMTLRRQGDAHEMYMSIIDAIIEEYPDAAGLFKSTIHVDIKCTSCDHQDSREEIIFALDVTYPDDHPEGKPYSFDNVIDKYIDTIKVPQECKKCKQRNLTETNKFTTLPQTLIIAVYPRFANNRRLKDIMAIPERVKMDTNQVYEITSIIDHQGSLRGGHYISKLYIDGKWWLVDDANIRSIPATSVINMYNYILTYQLL